MQWYKIEIKKPALISKSRLSILPQLYLWGIFIYFLHFALLFHQHHLLDIAERIPYTLFIDRRCIHAIEIYTGC